MTKKSMIGQEVDVDGKTGWIIRHDKITGDVGITFNSADPKEEYTCQIPIEEVRIEEVQKAKDRYQDMIKNLLLPQTGISQFAGRYFSDRQEITKAEYERLEKLKVFI